MQRHTAQSMCIVLLGIRKDTGWNAKHWTVTKYNLVQPSKAQNIYLTEAPILTSSQKKQNKKNHSVTEMLQYVWVWWQEKKSNVMKTNTPTVRHSPASVSHNMARHSSKPEVSTIMEQPWSFLQVKSYNSFVSTVLCQNWQTTIIRYQFCASQYIIYWLKTRTTEHQINIR